ncbi:hypothetical protein G5V59_10630 [Nocardioides sp. W3-2-3]|nr:hypothetical protein [Nocardioides convexus]
MSARSSVAQALQVLHRALDEPGDAALAHPRGRAQHPAHRPLGRRGGRRGTQGGVQVRLQAG